MMPAEPSGTPNDLYIDGQAAPSTESGNPSEMNAIYIKISSRKYMSDYNYL